MLHKIQYVKYKTMARYVARVRLILLTMENEII